MAKRTHLFTALLCFTLLVLTNCTNNKSTTATIDKERASKHIIPLKQADAYLSKFGSSKKELQGMMKDSSYLDTHFELPISETFNSDAIALLLQQEGCRAVRIYYGMDDSGKVRLVLLPVNKDGKDIRKKLFEGIAGLAAKVDGNDDGEAIEVGQRCPTMCDGLQ